MKSSKSFIQLATVVFFVLIGQLAFSQDEETKDRDFRFEIEPASFFLKGVAGSISYNITKDNNFSLGLYAATVDVPVFPRKTMFDNTVGTDTSSVRLGAQVALMARYRLKVFEEWESNPYVGLIAGWEYFDVSQPSNPDPVRLTTFLVTPYVGYEFYYFKQMLYINPQIRSVFYFGKGTNDATRPEKIGKFVFLPQISLGVRI